jgi:Ca-activated chloride channel family protein
MDGEKIDQARRALKYVLEHLNPGDRFNIITFATTVTSYARSPQPVSAVGDAEQFVDRIGAMGSTDINRALLEALSGADSTRPTTVIFLTDGLPTAGETDTQNILDNVSHAAGPNVRLFTFGVGDDVNTLLLDSLSESHRGASAYVRPGDKIDETVGDFYAKVSTPVLSDVSIDWGDISINDVYPYPLPDLFAGSQLVIVGRYRQSGPATITLKGTLNGQPQAYQFQDLTFKSAGFESPSQADAFIAPLWATRKIGYLLSQIRLHGQTQEAVDEIVSLAKRYGIVTPYTSFLVEEGQDKTLAPGLGGGAPDYGQHSGPALGPNTAPGSNWPAAQPTAAPATGATAVAQSQVNRALKEAEVAANDSNGQVKQVGDKAFVLRDGVWTDTNFDPTQMTPKKIQFGSSDYFEILTLHSEWSQYISLGEQVIFVVDGTAYQVTSS